jgi:hypothetical protein
MSLPTNTISFRISDFPLLLSRISFPENFSKTITNTKKNYAYPTQKPIEKITFSFSRIFQFSGQLFHFFFHKNLIRTITNILELGKSVQPFSSDALSNEQHFIFIIQSVSAKVFEPNISVSCQRVFMKFNNLKYRYFRR